MAEEKNPELRHTVRFFYDLQKLRIQTGNRIKLEKTELSEEQRESMLERSKRLKRLEDQELRKVEKHLEDELIGPWLLEQRGCGPTMAGVIISEIDITRADTPSALWAFCGLALETEGEYAGQAQRRIKGRKNPYNAWLRTKLVGVLAECMIKANSPWKEFYNNYKHRWVTMGKGKSDAHRHNAAKRYMIKMFLLELWKEWRTLEKLPVVPSYQERFGAPHGTHGLRAV